MNTLSFPQITVSYKDADASKRVKIHSSKESYDILKTFYESRLKDDAYVHDRTVYPAA